MKMGIYTKLLHREKKRKEINPIWRGIGCILMVVAPLVTFALTTYIIPLLVASGYVPLELLGHIDFPDWTYRLPVLSSTVNFIWRINNLGLGLIVFFVILVLLSGIFSLVYVAILQFIGPPRYSQIDAPPPKYKAKPYKR